MLAYIGNKAAKLAVQTARQFTGPAQFGQADNKFTIYAKTLYVTPFALNKRALETRVHGDIGIDPLRGEKPGGDGHVGMQRGRA